MANPGQNGVETRAELRQAKIAIRMFDRGGTVADERSLAARLLCAGFVPRPTLSSRRRTLMTAAHRPVAVVALDVPMRAKPSNYPEPFAALMAGRVKRQLGEVFGLSNFGVNLVRLAPGSRSALRHGHSRQDEFVYVLEGEAVLVTDRGETVLTPGMCAGFAAGTGDAHCLFNRGTGDALYLEIGDRSPDDQVHYPDDDLEARLGDDGRWRFVRKNGAPY